jgi:2-amino-4-hydroxy-6-hydroxymethyldihydropteridine diphosphokinase
VGLGSNEGDRLAHLRRAVARIDAGVLPGTTVAGGGAVIAVSTVVETRPVGPDPALAGGPYLNAALEVHLHEGASAEAIDRMMEALLQLEAEHGRVRRARWAARPLDLDLLLVLDPEPEPEAGWIARSLTTTRVTIPHPRMLTRDFVLAPLADLLPTEPVLDGRTAAQWLAGLREEDRTVLRRLDDRLR